MMPIQLLPDELRDQLPIFVREYLNQLILEDCQFEEDEQTRQEQERQLLAKTTYAEVTGTIDHPYTDIGKQVNLWIASHDEVRIRLYIGGSGCWLRPNNHYIFFHPIDTTLLPAEADLHTWWIIF